MIRALLIALLLLVACDDKVKVTIKVKTKEADAAVVNAAMACCQAETATKSVP